MLLFLHHHLFSQFGSVSMATYRFLFFFLVLAVLGDVEGSRLNQRKSGIIKLPTEKEEPAEEAGTRWAVLVAGSSGYGNYRHQVKTIS